MLYERKTFGCLNSSTDAYTSHVGPNSRQEMGHGGDALVKRVYGHLGNVGHRAEVVEYRVEQHQSHLVEGLRMLRIA